jgi:hypothetical protein
MRSWPRLDGASNRLIDVEDLSEAEVENLRKHYKELGKLLADKDEDRGSHSIEEKPKRRAKKK